MTEDLERREAQARAESGAAREADTGHEQQGRTLEHDGAKPGAAGAAGPAQAVRDQLASHPAGVAAGGAGGAAAGAVSGMAAGPLGSLAGAVAGAALGGVAGSGGTLSERGVRRDDGAAEGAQGPRGGPEGQAGTASVEAQAATDAQRAREVARTPLDPMWQRDFTNKTYVAAGAGFDDYEPAYRYGAWARLSAAGNPDFNYAEPALEAGWDAVRGNSRLTWHEVREAAFEAWVVANRKV